MKRTVTLLSLALGVVVHGAQGCGIDWSLPKNHFDGVNEFGFVSIWENIGNIDLGDGLVLPLNANFRSDRTASSSTLGTGWHLALLDANIVQIDERTFMMFDPAGPFRLFWRDPKNPNILSGQAGWKAAIQNDSITAWSDCGAKLIFNKGRIVSIQLKEKTFTYNYQDGKVAEIHEGNKLILTVKKKPITGEVTGLSLLGNQEIQIEQAERPRIQSIQGKNLVVGKDMTLGKVSAGAGVQKTYDYGVTVTLQPTVTVTDIGKSPRQIVWDTATRFITADGDWTYDIKPSPNKGFNAAIERINSKKQKEFWSYDSIKGIEKLVTTDGNTELRSWFVSGSLAGKPRSVYSGNEGYKYIYDEKGDCKSKIFKNGDVLRFEHSTKKDTCILSFKRQNGSNAIRTISVSGDKQWTFASENITKNKTVSYSYNTASGFLKIDESQSKKP